MGALLWGNGFGSLRICLPAARCKQATLFGKIDDLQFALLRVRILIRKIGPVTCLAVQHGSGGAFGGDGS
jgi:hypothetical protein